MDNKVAEPALLAGSIASLQSLSLIGTKLQAAKVMGPQSQKNHLYIQLVSGTLGFDFTRQITYAWQDIYNGGNRYRPTALGPPTAGNKAVLPPLP